MWIRIINFKKLFYSVFSLKNCISMLTKFQIRQELKHNDHAQRREFVELLNINKWMPVIGTKSFLAIVHFILMALLIVKIALFWGSENPYVKGTHNVSLFGADFGLGASLDRKYKLVK